MTDAEYYMIKIKLEDRRKKVKALQELEKKNLYNFSGRADSGRWENVILTKEEGSVILQALLSIYKADIDRLEDEINGIDERDVERTVV
ncbi:MULTISPECIES: hypothetical protein [Erysipelotrichaceae]|uniref:Uncharacterized protein n=1 Tax=Amedibacterium intestinale TaxID=2583452 RepID=A0A6N4THG0_9FIRM|nr:hypothetical protein [Amedibacterium intestinale]RHO19721.1 hypothetical protein DW220_10610 [Eubacterium sp. AM18-26]RHO23025.1 hypothetical protein DW212_11070 [Eubacterium sp. AM18-10LB-B]BBK22646.1 hypothetical protein Aargi30884_15490 [Amedibacterium intestinale]